MSSMINKICIVTGATSGIGKETAIALARQGAHLIIIGRNKKKCIKTTHYINRITGNASIEYICADLSCLSQVLELSNEITGQYKHIDVLLNNAGGYFIARKQTEDGYEMNFALNYLSPFLLTLLLVDALKQSDQGRIVNVSSQAHTRASIQFNDLQMTHGFNGLDAYAQSKLAILLFTYELARRLKDTHVTVNALHPGLVASDFGKNNGLLRFYLRRLLKRDEITCEEGAKTSVYLASSPALDKCTGGYYINKQMVDSSAASYDLSVADKLWRMTHDLVGF